MEENVTNVNQNTTKKVTRINGKMLLRKFAGDNYEKVLKGKFSIPAFFFGGCYFIYRKMYTIGTILCVVMSIAGFAIPDKKLSAVIALALALYSGSDFSKQYIKFAEKKITEIYENDDSNEERVINDKIIKAGGTDIKLAVIIPVALSVVFGLIFQGIMQQ